MSYWSQMNGINADQKRRPFLFFQNNADYPPATTAAQTSKKSASIPIICG